MKIRVISVLILLLVLVPAAYGQAPEPDFDQYVEKAMKEWEVPGLAIAIVKDDRIVFAKGYGVRELGGTAAVNEQTLFAIGSSSKAFTAATVALLVDEGKLKWDDPVTKYLPSYQLFDPYSTRELTVRDLLTHRGGLERGDLIWYASPHDRNEVLRRIRFLKPTWSLRSRFGYQNIMYLAAGQISPALIGKEWDDVVRERIFIPLGMNASNTSIRKFAGVDNVASPHSKIDDKLQKVAWRNVDNIGPAGSINSNVVDMAQWLRLNLGGGMYEKKRILSAASVREMQMPQTVIRIEGNNERLYPEAHFLSYGLGWFLSDYRGRKLVEHGGAIDGMRAAVGMLPEEKLGVVILTNRNGSVLPHVLMYRVFDAYLGVAKRDWSADMFRKFKVLEDMAKAAEKKTEDERVKNTSPSLALEKYAGTYKSEMYGETKFALQNGKLTSEFGPNFNGDLEHWHYDTFRVIWRDRMEGKGFVVFKLNAKGQPETVSIDGLGDFTRVPDKPAPGAVSSN
jgi:CubicO group peptidase (beta-lactamase class C family)